jgi:hypothetical protein
VDLDQCAAPTAPVTRDPLDLRAVAQAVITGNLARDHDIVAVR